jgi:hypothetical protein
MLEDARTEKQTLIVRMRRNEEHIPRISDRVWHKSGVTGEDICKQDVEKKRDKEENHDDRQHNGGLLPRSATAQMLCDADQS